MTAFCFIGSRKSRAYYRLWYWVRSFTCETSAHARLHSLCWVSTKGNNLILFRTIAVKSFLVLFKKETKVWPVKTLRKHLLLPLKLWGISVLYIVTKILCKANKALSESKVWFWIFMNSRFVVCTIRFSLLDFQYGCIQIQFDWLIQLWKHAIVIILFIYFYSFVTSFHFPSSRFLLHFCWASAFWPVKSVSGVGPQMEDLLNVAYEPDYILYIMRTKMERVPRSLRNFIQIAWRWCSLTSAVMTRWKRQLNTSTAIWKTHKEVMLTVYYP